MKFIKWFWLLSLITTSAANAAFVGENIPGDGDGYVDVVSATEFTLYSSNNGIEDITDNFYSFVYTDLATSDIKVTFNWSYTTLDEDGSYDGDYNESYYLDPVGYLLNGVKTQLNSAVLAQYGTENGTGSFIVVAGSTFGFYADTDDNSYGSGALTIRNLSITPVPEPSSYALFLAGLGLLGFVASRKQA